MHSLDTNPLPAVTGAGTQPQRWVPTVLTAIALTYLSLVLFLPILNVFIQAFNHGFGPFWANLTESDSLHAIWLTLLLALVVVPLNTVFGLCAAWAIARHQFPGRVLLLSIIDLPFSVSPVVAGLMIVLLYGRNGWFGPWLEAINLKVTFAFPGMVIATAFVTLPFVAREVIPVLEEVGSDQEEAARILGASDWQTFWRVTLPNIRWGLIYGVILTNARAMGEIGAVLVVSGNILGKTQTLPVFIEEAYKQYETQSAYAAAVLLALLALVTLAIKELLERRTRIQSEA
ncbi:sulfate ABC transporter permease subunit CysW [Neosynechococcus sphagnicola]|uniref:sulfate ABC transporter permease subunit CysW n=1 Tax=Neosynechococcus sphagnicola TaxID=1501145 RepID=UPI00068AEA85|nr:sulfate ABC transporter permease subunit CysW [Neosynechococcus sphagnicola]